jgi:predicted nucleotidyltransferase
MNIQTIKHLALPVLKKYGILRASLFGSAVRGEMNESSDIDMLVELPQNVHGYDYVALKVDLQEELESILGKKVDVVEYDLIKPALKEYILPTQEQII